MRRRNTFKQTGLIWREKSQVRVRIVAKVTTLLERRYGRPRFGNPKEPVSDLIYIIMSNKTAPVAARRTYRRLRKSFTTWEDLLDAPISKLRSILWTAGLSAKKSRQIRAALRTIKRDFGRCDLRKLRTSEPTEAHDYLVSLPGVSDKVAKCVLMYTMNAPVLPVDSHVHRITKRLGWNKRKRADQCHEELEALVPPSRRYAFHVDCIAHGRLICRPENPLCDKCCVNRYCAYFRGRQT